MLWFTTIRFLGQIILEYNKLEKTFQMTEAKTLLDTYACHLSLDHG